MRYRLPTSDQVAESPHPEVSSEVEELVRPSRPDSSCLYDYESSELLFDPKEDSSEREEGFDLENDATPLKYPSLSVAGEIPELSLRDKLAPEEAGLPLEGAGHCVNLLMNALEDSEESPVGRRSKGGATRRWAENGTT